MLRNGDAVQAGHQHATALYRRADLGHGCGLGAEVRSSSFHLFHTAMINSLISIHISYSNWGKPVTSAELTTQCDLRCWQYFAVDRLSLAFVLYHAFLCVLMLGVRTKESPRAIFNNGYVVVIVGAFRTLTDYIAGSGPSSSCCCWRPACCPPTPARCISRRRR